MEKMSNRTLIFLLLIGNILPIIGILFLSWDIFFIIFLYIIESGILILSLLIPFSRHFWVNCRTKGEYLLLMEILVIFLLGTAFLACVIPLDYVMEKAPEGHMFDKEYDNIYQLFYPASNRTILIAVLLILLSQVLSQLKEIKSSSWKIQSTWMLFFSRASVLYVFVFIGVFSSGRYTFNVPFAGFFITLKALSDYLIFKWLSSYDWKEIKKERLRWVHKNKHRIVRFQKKK